MKFRTRSTAVDAIPWRGDNEAQVLRVIAQGRTGAKIKTVKAKKGKGDEPDLPERRVVAVSYDGEEVGKAEVGQWIVRGPQGEAAILDAAEFNRQYERIASL